MTGEITLRGAITAIGGVKEKVIAALRSGIKDVILPEENRKDLEDIPEDIKNEITFYPVSHASEVIKLALIPEKKKETELLSAIVKERTDKHEYTQC